jgi:MYXO-CTERM domain-containing protein
MKRVLATAVLAGVLSFGTASVALAQDDTTTDVANEATNDQGDTGLLGLIGLAGLAGLLGLRRRDDDRSRTYDRDRAGVR